MWIILGTAAIVSAILNTCFTLRPSRREMVPLYRPVADRPDALRMVQSGRALGRGERLGCVRRYVSGDGEGFLDADDRFNRDQQRFFIHEREIPIQERENANPQS